MLDRIKDMLRSDDLEMVQLGAVWVEQNLPPERWPEVFDYINQSKFQVGIASDIFVREYDLGQGIWVQLNKSYKYTYNIKTGAGGMALLQKAIQQYEQKTDKGRTSI